MDAQMKAAEEAARKAADREDEIKKDYEEPLMRGLTRGPDGLTANEIKALVDGQRLQELARMGRSLVRGGEVVVLKRGQIREGLGF